MLYALALAPAVAFAAIIAGMVVGTALHVSRRKPIRAYDATPVVPAIMAGVASVCHYRWPVDAEAWPLMTFPEFLAQTGQPWPAADRWRSNAS